MSFLIQFFVMGIFFFLLIFHYTNAFFHYKRTQGMVQFQLFSDKLCSTIQSFNWKLCIVKIVMDSIVHEGLVQHPLHFNNTMAAKLFLTSFFFSSWHKTYSMFVAVDSDRISSVVQRVYFALLECWVVMTTMYHVIVKEGRCVVCPRMETLPLT